MKKLTPQRRSNRRRVPLMKASEQYCLDFGQKNFDPIRCEVCGMIYVVGEESDEKQHARYHAAYDEGIKWTTKMERPVKYFDDGSRIVTIKASDPKQTLDAVNRVLKMSENDMSVEDDVCKILKSNDMQFLIYINSSHHIIGYICTEPIKQAYCLIDYEKSQLETEPVPADCGVIYLWVHPTHRLQMVGTWLTDIARANLYKKRLIPRSRVAVCDPTSSAIPFFTKYLRNKRPIRVYQQQ